MSGASNQQYEALSRSIVALARLRGGPQPADLCMHKALMPPANAGSGGAGAGKSAVEDWLAAQIRATSPRQVLDVGCGFGSLLAALRRRWNGDAIGINASAFPVHYGMEFWREQTPEAAPTLRQGAFGCAVPEGPFDAVVAVESLGYCDDLASTLGWLRGLLSPGGQAWILDDWRAADLTREDRDLRALCRCWRRSQLYSGSELIAEAGAQGLELRHSTRLTAQVPATASRPGALRRRVLTAITRVGGEFSLGQLGAAYLGGWHLENLYARGRADYELLVLGQAR